MSELQKITDKLKELTTVKEEIELPKTSVDRKIINDICMYLTKQEPAISVAEYRVDEESDTVELRAYLEDSDAVLVGTFRMEK